MVIEVVAALAVGVLLGVGAHLGWGPPAASGAPVEVAGVRLDRGAAGSSVVEVHADGCGTRRQASATFLRSPDGDELLLTNVHVVRGATQVLVGLPDGGTVDVAVLGALRGRDAALLDPAPLVAAGLDPAEQGHDVAPGTPVVVAGFPSGSFDLRPAAVLDVQRRAAYGGASDVLLVGTSAVGGHSGGAVLDVDGAVVGIIAARDPLSRDVVAYPLGALVGVPVGDPPEC